jgi:hypothetical protein
MWTMLDMIGVLALGVVLAAPLVYALAMLHGLHHKIVYPLIRVRDRDGRLMPLVLDGRASGAPTFIQDVADRDRIRQPV